MDNPIIVGHRPTPRATTGIGFRTRSEAAFIDMGAAPYAAARQIQSTVPYELFRHLPWSPWGDDNLAPDRLLQDIETCGILFQIIDSQARYGICEGIRPVIMGVGDRGERIIEKYVDDAEILDFLEANDHYTQGYGWLKDLRAWSWGAGRFVLNQGYNKIVSFQRDDVTECRYDRKDPRTGKMSRLWYSGAWAHVRNTNDERVFSEPLLDRTRMLQDLREKAAEKVPVHAFTFGMPGWGKHYYPTQPWFPAYLWVKIAQGIPEMKASLYKNAMRPKYMIIIQEEFWEKKYGAEWPLDDPKKQEEIRQGFYDEVDEWLVGAKNSNKSIFTQGYRDADGNVWTDIEIKAIEDNTKNGELLPDDAAANTAISFVMGYNLGANGGNQKSGLYSENQGGSNIREAGLDQVIRMEPERRQIMRIMNVIRDFNGWNTGKFKGLEFIIPATILTTLDTGGGTKPIVTGGAQPNDKKNKKEAA
ncbi:MAG: hypothetical protein EOP84_05580 [Verrucomicrobiaceae bacterium]|nr:MAG: hypothetical protein EOP84_05580 [Verrucomicrobiaceae bacterium]